MAAGIGLLSLLIALALATYFFAGPLLREAPAGENGEKKSVIETDLSAIQSAQDIKNKLEARDRALIAP